MTSHGGHGRRAIALAIAATLASAVVLGVGVAGASVNKPRPRPAPSAPSTQVAGAVIDREGQGVAGATVIARPVGLPVQIGVASKTFETTTDGRGQFQLDGLPPGTYWFIALRAGLPAGASPALPVIDHLEVSIHLDDHDTRA